MKTFTNVQDIFKLSEVYKSIVKDEDGNYYIRKWIGYVKQCHYPLVHYNKFLIYQVTQKSIDLFVSRSINEEQLEEMALSKFIESECASTKAITIKQIKSIPSYMKAPATFFSKTNHKNLCETKIN